MSLRGLLSWCSIGTLLLQNGHVYARSVLADRAVGVPVANASVLILGGGVAGVIAARTLYEQGITDFMIVEARDELGGRLQTETIGAPGNEWVVERGPNWVQGTQTGNGPENPIWALVKKHGVKTQYNDWYDSMTTYDESGYVNYTDTFNESGDGYDTLTVAAGARVAKKLVDMTARTGYSLIGAKPQTPADKACEYYQFDWEYAQTPEESSWIASSWGNNFTYDPDDGGFGDDNQMSIDQRGFKYFIQAEAAEFLQPEQVKYNATVTKIAYSSDGVDVTLASGEVLSADYVLCTFSVGVLQNDDVTFDPPLPAWKQEAIQGIVMATYTKIFLQFEEDFWFDTQMGLYADTTRGRYPVWQNMNLTDFFPGSGVVFVTVTGEYSVRVEALSDEEVKEEVLGVLKLMYPNVTIPEPTAFYFPRWHTNPLFRGSYSNWPSSFFNGHHENLRATVNQRLWFAGEATSLKYFGFLHGAYFEGLDVGTTLANCIWAGGCAGMAHVPEVTNAYPYKV
ncbi:amine oxidase [Wolfiporia cocos MD-104 SS10]|uniref:Amine oxidase n=1 Tax=Wolfiporia cocos (strain MD-104) TaxID=742152 RepID=A0A2H3JYM2_WOLCO|nr:amine oxidase [Wolfiporia cocos MD-104 SS10]